MGSTRAETPAVPLAVVGFSFRLPQEATDEPGLWDMLSSGRNVMSGWPKDRASLNHTTVPGAHFMKDDPAVFDAPFFSITAKEAATIDPQHRLALEVAYHAFENAGIPIESLHGTQTAVFGASMSNDWSRMITKDPDTMPRQTVTSIAPSLLPNRISWFFDLRGPSVYLDTACSSGMIALDMAAQSIASGDSSAALVVATNVLLTPESTTMLQNLNFLSPDGKCFSFDARGNGYARGEGVVAMLIKPLDDAIRDGDIIRAVIRATASNQDGKTPGLTQPSAKAQEALMRRAYAKANLDFKDTRYVEAHGTGTPTGDPIEMKAIGSVFNSHRLPDQPLFVGSIKANMGHLEGASGLAGLVKSILMLERGVIPPTALFEVLNPDIEREAYNIKVPTANIQWPQAGLRRISVNSFGFGGANAHVILDDASHYLKSRKLVGHHHCAESSSNDQDMVNGATVSTMLNQVDGEPRSVMSKQYAQSSRPRILVWSATDAAAVQRMVEVYEPYFRAHIAGDERKLDQLAYTLSSRRSVMSWRSFTLVDGNDESSFSFTKNLEKPARASSDRPRLGFVFTGQGAQYAKMGLGLLQYPVFEESLKKSESVLASIGCEWSLFDELDDGTRVGLPELSQPLCTALQIALVDLLRSFNIIPVGVVGHSSGEIAAAYTANYITHESACKIAFYRGKLAGHLCQVTDVPGAMLSVNLTEAEVLEYIDVLKPETENDSLHIACLNSPSNLTLSGPARSIDRMKERLDQDGVFAQKVSTGVAYHSPAMRSIATEYKELLEFLDRTGPDNEAGDILMVSSVTGQPVSSEVLNTPSYWVDNLVSKVRFTQAVQFLTKKGPSSVKEAFTDLVEVGPHAALRRPVKDSAPSLRYHSVLYRSKSPLNCTLNLLGSLFCHGHPVSVAAANSQGQGNLPFLVDCPPYPFDRTRRYWKESSISKGYRLREYHTAFLLGNRAIDWNPMHPRWKNQLSTEQIPWLGDHMVSGAVVCPGTGMLVMAIEAVRQLESSDQHRKTSGFTIRDAQFLAPIRVGKTEQDNTEVELHLRRVQKADEKEPTWSEVRIFSSFDESWSECFRAEIKVEYEEQAGSRAEGELRQEQEYIQGYVEKAKVTCTEHCETHAFYRYCKKSGLQYGKTFQLLDSIAWDRRNASSATINMSNVESGDVDNPVHPAVLDAAFHLLLAQVSKGLDTSTFMPTLVPKKLGKAWISAKIWSQATSSVYLASHTAEEDPISSSADLFGTIRATGDDGSPLCTIEDLAMAQISGPEPQDSTQDRPLLYGISWKPKLSSLRPKQLEQICSQGRVVPDNSLMKSYYPKMERVLRLAARKAVAEVTDAELAPGHMRQYAQALTYQYQLHNQGRKPESISKSALESLLQECEAQCPEWFLFPAVARALPSILRGKTDPLELMFATRAADLFYTSLFGTHMHDGRFQVFLELAAHENPQLDILEVGAGTGGFTREILNCLQSVEDKTGASAFRKYTFTDLSPGFFDAARVQFQDRIDRFEFKVLDVEQDPEATPDSGLEQATYDIIFAGSVLHATSNLTTSLTHLRKLLKPGGYLVFQETTSTDSACINVGFGSLKGWWLSTEPWRQNGPLADVTRWDQLLRETGFSGVDLALRDHEDEMCHFSTVMISKAVAEQQRDVENHTQPSLVFFLDQETEAQRNIMEKIGSPEVNKKVVQLDNLDEGWSSSENDVVVSLVEVGSPKLASLDPAGFRRVQRLIQGSKNLLWVTAAPEKTDPGADLITDPYSSVATGFLRGIRSEETDKHIVSLAAESHIPEGLDNFINEVLDSCFYNANPCPEIEFVLRNGHLTVGRMVLEKALGEEHISRVQPQLRTEPWSSGPPLRVQFETPGMLESLRMVEDSVPREPLAPDEVEISASVWPLSFRDIFIALGKLGNEALGFECAGTVSRVGSACASEFNIGDRVVMGVCGSMRSHPRGKAHTVHKIPDHISFNDAVAAVNPAITAWQGLVNIARLQKGERVLIHSAAGATGQMGLGIAKLVGAEIFATVSSEEKKQLLIEKFDIPESHIFHSRSTFFAQGIKRLTSGYGVDVVLNSLAGDSLRASWECIAPYGRFIEIGKTDILANSALPMSRFANNVTFAAVNLYHIVQASPMMSRDLMSKILDLVFKGDLNVPTPLHLFPMSQTEKAFRYMQSGKNTGRILLVASADEKVEKQVIHKSTWTFSADASYVIAGGLGGLGRYMIKWMAEKGARNFIVLSRSGISSQAALDTVQWLKERGACVAAPRCDVSSASAVSQVLQECAGSMPPIKGCINSAMALQDAVFFNMTHAQWATTVGSKVHASWNLHTLLPKDMDFFILLSSLAGIYGTIAQSNYAAGCAFQDGLARMRTAAGMPVSISLDLGWMADVGIVSERAEYRRNREKVPDMSAVAGTDLLALLDYYCDPELAAQWMKRGLDHSQLLVGALTPANFTARAQDSPPALQRPLFHGFTRTSLKSSSTGQDSTGASAAVHQTPAMLFRAATTPEERSAVVVEALKVKLARALDVEPDYVAADKTLSDYGVDSLMAVELRNWIRNDFGAAVTVFDIMGGAAIAAVGDLVVAKAAKATNDES